MGGDQQPTVDAIIVLQDGRQLGFAEWGDPDGAPVMLFHGSPGSRLLCPDANLTLERSVRLIATDRPGYGSSDPKPGRRLTEWPDDVKQLADHLGIDRFGVLGWSAGGPHALACTIGMPDRVTVTGLVASPGPTDEVPGVLDTDVQRRMVYDGAVQDREGTAAAVIAFLEPVDGNDGRRWLDGVRTQYPDAIVYSDPLWERNFEDHVIEGMRPGGEGRAEDAVASWGPWDFSPKDVAGPVVAWYGGNDDNVTREHFNYLSSSLPSCTPVFWPDDSHVCIYNRWSDILATITAIA